MLAEKEITTIVLPAKLTPVAAEDLLTKLRAVPRDQPVNVDAAHVAKFSPAYLQIVLSAVKTFAHIGLANTSAEMKDALDACQLTLPQALGLSATAATPELSVTEQGVPDFGGKTQPETPGEERQERAQPLKILTIDDSRTMRDMLKMTLANAGFTVIQAVDGEDGLNALADQPVDLIITDINMPKLDGYGVVQAVRSDPAYHRLPILVLSTEDEQSSKDKAKDAGATGWIVKPFDPDGLVQVVNRVCA